MYELDAIETVVDVKHLTHLDDEMPEDVETEAQEQLAFVDIVLLIDFVSAEAELQKIEARIREPNLIAQILRTQQSVVDWKRLLGVGAFDAQRVLEFEFEFLTKLDEEHKHDEGEHSDAGLDRAPPRPGAPEAASR